VALAGASAGGNPAVGVATVVGRGRAASAVAAELMDVLADEPRVVECDLAGLAEEGSAITDALGAVSNYLARWPGPVIMMQAPDPVLRARLALVASSERMIIHSSWEAAGETHQMLPPLQRQRLQLPAQWTAARAARRFTARTLDEWLLGSAVDAASQVVDELVAHTVKHAVAAVDLMVSRVDGRVRVAVRDEGPRAPLEPDDASAFPLQGPGLQLVQAFAESWGVIPARAGGKTLWAVVDTNSPHASGSSAHPEALSNHRVERHLRVVSALPLSATAHTDLN
jgi:anti-sigma regulatory factor (Ser/Thr protein kinase)